MGFHGFAIAKLSIIFKKTTTIKEKYIQSKVKYRTHIKT